MNDWRDLALCQWEPPDDWFPHPSDEAGIRYAKAACRACPVIRDCASWSLVFRPRLTDGVFGGMSEADRLRIWRAQSRQSARDGAA